MYVDLFITAVMNDIFPILSFYAGIGSGALNENQANYTLLWIDGAQKIYNCTMNYIGVWNEDNWSSSYVKLLRSMLDSNGYEDTKIVVADEALGSVNKIIATLEADPDFAKSFDIIGVHYPSASTDIGNMSSCGKKLWSSEDSSTSFVEYFLGECNNTIIANIYI